VICVLSQEADAIIINMLSGRLLETHACLLACLFAVLLAAVPGCFLSSRGVGQWLAHGDPCTAAGCRLIGSPAVMAQAQEALQLVVGQLYSGGVQGSAGGHTFLRETVQVGAGLGLTADGAAAAACLCFSASVRAGSCCLSVVVGSRAKGGCSATLAVLVEMPYGLGLLCVPQAIVAGVRNPAPLAAEHISGAAAWAAVGSSWRRDEDAGRP